MKQKTASLTFVALVLFGISSVLCDTNYTPPKLTQEPGDTFGIEGQSLQLQCQATGNPTPTYTWEKDGQEIDFSKPGYSLQNGYLKIDSFDQQNDVGAYQCVVRLSYSDKELKLISRLAKVTVATVPTGFKRDIQPVTAYSGGAMRLSVDASNFLPAPKIAWNYRGKPSISSNDPRFTVLPNGILQAHSLTSSDDGKIRAVALASGASGTKSGDIVYGKFQEVTVQAASNRPSTKEFYFLSKPQDLDINWGRAIILESMADSGDSVTYSWFKDGQPMKLSGRKSILGQGNLKILYAKEEDSGSYKVVVKSGGKTIEATANVNVMSPPRFTIVPPPRVTGYEEDTVTFNFNLIGNPTPKVTWYRDGIAIISTDNYADPQKDKLILKELITYDSGMYQARASNAMGDAEFSLELLILPVGASTPPPIVTVPIKKPSPPQNLATTGQTDSTISLSWQLPTLTVGNIQNYRIEYKDIQGGAPQSTVTTDLAYTITGLQPSSTYKIRIQAINSNGVEGEFTTFLTSTTKSAPVPPKTVININNVVSGTDLQLTWQPDPSGPTPTSYRVDYTNIDTQKQDSVTVYTPSTTLTGLSAGSSYSFSITPMLNLLEGGASTLTTVLIPDAVIPKPGLPLNLEVNGKTDSSISLSWEQPSPLPSSGVKNYQIEYKDSMAGTTGSKVSPTTSFTINGLQPSTTYEIRMRAIDNQDNTGDFTPVKSVTTSSGPITVDSLQTIIVTPTTMELQWQPPVGGPTPTSYQIHFINMDNQVKLQATSSQPKFTLRNLQPFTNYQVFVVPVFLGGPGKESSKLTVRTKGQVPAPTGLSAVLINTTSSKVSWNAIPKNKIQGSLHSYSLSYFKVGERTNTLRQIPDIKQGDHPAFIIKGLQEHSTYQVTVKAVLNDRQESPSSIPLTFKTNRFTSEGPDPATSFSMTQDPNAPDYITLSWTEPKYISGVLENYFVYFKEKNTPKYTVFPLPGTYNNHRITDFEEGTEYVGHIVPFDGNGAGVESNEAPITTLSESQVPLAPIQLVVNTNADSLHASWKPAVSDIIVRGYNVKARTSGGTEVYSGKLASKSNSEIKLYDGIEPDTSYIVEVQAFNNMGASPITSLPFQTLIAPSPSLVVTQVDPSPTGMVLKWRESPVNPNAVSYIVRYGDYAADGTPITKTVTTDQPEATINELTPFTRYKFSIKRDGDAGFPAQPNVDIKTLEAVPSAPLGVNYFQMNGYRTWALVDWQTPAQPNGVISNYTVFYTSNEDVNELSQMSSMTTKGDVLSQNVTGLIPGTNYKILVCATNSAGNGDTSAPVIMDVGGGGFRLNPVVGTTTNGGFDWWWLLLLILLLLLLLLLILLCIYCCCCGWCLRCCFGCCPCCKGCWYCCCLPCLVCCCPCWCDKEKYDEEQLYISSPVTAHSRVSSKVNGNASGSGIGVGAWKGDGKVAADNVEMIPLTTDVQYAPSSHSGMSGVGSLSRRTSKSSEAAIKVPIPGDATFISFKTSLQDYCQKVGWLPPVYLTNQFDEVYHSKVTFGGSTFDSGSEFGPSRQDAEQRAAHASLIGLGCLDATNKYSNDVNIAVPIAGDASFISYKCSLHDFCQQCNILPPRFSTSGNDTGFSSSVQVGSHTFNMSSRVQKSTEAEQKVAFIALQGLCMMDSQAGYFPEACFTVPGPGDASFVSFKSSLHDFCQKYKLPPPQYITNQGSHGYSAKLKFGGLFFQSSSHFTSRIEAEQHAAFEALQGLGLLESSVEFDSALTSGGVHIGAGGGAAGVVVGGLNSSRAASKANSRSSSRPASRPSSRPPSRQGSITQLNVSDNYNMNTSVDQRDTSYNSLDSRSYAAGSGYDAHNSLNRNEQYIGNHSVSYQGGHARNGSVSGGQSASSTLSRTGNDSITGKGSVSIAINSSSSGNQKTVTGYEQDGDVYAFSYSNYTGSGTVPRSRSKSVEQNYDNVDGENDGGNSSHQNMMEYEQHSRASSGYATMPRKQIATNTSNGSSSYAQFSSSQSSYSTSSTSRSYSTSNTMNRSYGYGGAEVRGTASQPAIPDLEKEMAGLEGLIKDLNGITNSGKAT